MLAPLCVERRVGDVVRVAPQTPLGEINLDDPVPEEIEIAEMRVIEPRSGVRSAEPADERSKKLVAEWEAKYLRMSKEDFYWLPGGLRRA